MIRAVVFDCFGVMYIPKSDYVYQSLLVNPTVHHDEIRDLVKQNEYGFISDDELFAGIASYTGKPLDEIRRQLVGGFTRNQELLDFAQQLRSEHKVALLSNLGRDTMHQYFTPEEQAQFFDVVVVSGAVGMIKPHPAIFEYACQQLGVATSEAVMIDDVQDNCDGAREAGMQAIRYQSLEQVKAELGKLL